jgi:hypothetical protein
MGTTAKILARLAAGVLVFVLASCASPPVPAPIPPAPPPQAACTAKNALAVDFENVGAVDLGKCVRIRGLAVESILYENGAKYALWQKWYDNAPSFVVGLAWSASEPPALKSHPQFIEVTGALMSCLAPRIKSCGLAPIRGIKVTGFKIIPTAMD